MSSGSTLCITVSLDPLLHATRKQEATGTVRAQPCRAHSSAICSTVMQSLLRAVVVRASRLTPMRQTPLPRAQGMLLHVLGALGASAALILGYALLVVLRPSPLWAARWALPFLGLLLGGAVRAHTMLIDLSGIKI